MAGSAKRRANGEGSPCKRKDGRWSWAATLDGKRRWFYGKTRAEAHEKYQAARSQAQRGRLVAGKEAEQTVRDFLAHWVDDQKQPALRPTSYVAYRTRLGHVIPHLGHLKIGTLRPQHIQSCYAALAQAMDANTVRAIHVILKGALERAVQWDILDRNPAAYIELPKPIHREMRVLTIEQVQQLIAATAGDRLHALWVTMVTTGIRIGEALALTWDDVDLLAGWLHVRRTLYHHRGVGIEEGPPKSRAGVRSIPLPPTAIHALSVHQQCQRRGMVCGLIFPNLHGEYSKTGSVSGTFALALERAGLPHVRLHDLRHTAATIMLAASGYDIREVAEYLGHSSPSITLNIYAHVMPAKRVETTNRMEEMLGGAR